MFRHCSDRARKARGLSDKHFLYSFLLGVRYRMVSEALNRTGMADPSPEDLLGDILEEFDSSNLITGIDKGRIRKTGLPISEVLLGICS